MKRHAIKIFEHDTLSIGQNGFKESHFKALVQFNERYGGQYLTPGFNKVKFGSYVGVYQVANLAIEVLPKADRGDDKDKWRRALLSMLHECRYIRLHSLQEAELKLRSASLIDLFFDAFLLQVEQLAHRGLTKTYRQVNENRSALKGKLLLDQQIKHNSIHRERFFVRYFIYNNDTTMNRILKQALNILTKTAANPWIASRSNTLLLHFENVHDEKITAQHFKRLSFNRKTDAYKTAVQLARLIILHYSPDLAAGRESVLAILFDMNTLFEEYVFRILQRSKNTVEQVKNIRAQQHRRFWNNQNIRPDILIELVNGKRLIVDTKWKYIVDYRPADADLKQMFVYNIHFNAEKSVLLYPGSDQENKPACPFEKSIGFEKKHWCRLFFASLFNEEGQPIPGAGGAILKDIIS